VSGGINGKSQIKNPESAWIKIPDHHPAIIGKDLFSAVHEIVEEKSELRRKRKIGTS